MAGHSKWANIKHRKQAQDAAKGKVFTKLIRELTTASRLGGPIPADNPRLRAAIDKALTANMTRDTIDRAIKRGAGGEGEADLEELTYEGYGMGGVAVVVETMTNNRNRTASDVRYAFTKCGGNLGQDGSVSFLFKKRGEIYFEAGVNEDALMEAALDAGAEDVIAQAEGGFLVITTPESFGSVQDQLIHNGFKPAGAEVTMSATTQTDITDIETAEKILKMLDMLEDLDDVQNVYSNVNIATDIMEKLAK
ncbi:MAG TPA: YebC/PmpR family DNA-binding transcriptional regulator [Pseudomonadales bacterium]|nr:YebC/PmpR family DNA-binding transcriptional regulator [Pseudomonadales bacterium]